MKKLQFIIIFLCLVLIANSKNVSTETAQNAAENFFKQKGISSPKLKLNYTSVFQSDLSSENQEIPAFYIFTVSPNGFVIISADDAVQPLLAYSIDDNINVDDLSPSLEYWLNNYKKQIKAVVDKHGVATKEISRLWDNILNKYKPNNNTPKAVTNLLTTTWNQSPYYNQLCPSSEGQQCPAGCVATAMAQIMKYWNWPTQGVGSHSYSSPVGGTLSASFGNTNYDWSNMPNNLTASSSSTSKNAIATLMYHCGISVNMSYGVDGSGAYSNSYDGSSYYANSSQYAFPTYFKYKTTIASYYRDNYSGVPNDNVSETQWINLLKTEFDAGRPVLYTGSEESSGSGHAWVCSGYDSSDNFYMNWGWGPYGGNGFYSVNNLSSSALVGEDAIALNDGQSILIGIEPINVVTEMKVPITGNNSYNVCEGTIYDNGGSTGNYSGSLGIVQEGYTILYPETTGNKISISGTYAVEQGYDYIYIYDGAGTTTTPIQTLSGSGTLSTITSTASNGALTIKLYADNYTDDTGFAFDIACIGVPSLSMYSNISINPSTIAVGEAINLTASIRNSGTATFTGNVKAAIFNASNTEIATIQQKSFSSDPLDAGYFNTGINFYSTGIPSLGEGTYNVKLLYQINSSEPWSLLANSNYTNSKTLIVQNPVSIDDDNLENINIYPNPANEFIYVKAAENSNYQIIDVLGKIIKEGIITSERNEINVSDINRGTYLIKIFEDNKVIVKRITKL